MAEKKEVDMSKKEPTGTTVERYPAFVRPLEEMERWFAGRFPRTWPTFARVGAMFERVPAVDIIDHDDEVIVRAEVPGVRKEDLKISLADGEITIQGHTEHKEEEKRTDYYYHEMSYGDFKRTLTLPAAVDTAKAHAKMKDGVLEIQLPKVERAKRREVDLEIR